LLIEEDEYDEKKEIIVRGLFSYTWIGWL
jgi:hypothetical protein